MMRHISFLTTVFFISSILITGSNGQVKLSGIGASLGTNFLIGDSPVENSRLAPGFDLYTIYDVSPNFHLKYQIGFNRFVVENTRKVFLTSSLPVELSVLYHIKNNSNITPLLQAGIGVMGFSFNGSPLYFDGLFSGGAGLKSPVSEKLSFQVLANLTYTTGDDFNGYNGGFLKDGFLSLQTGLTYHPEQEQFERKNNQERENIIAGTRSYKDSLYFSNLKLNSQISNFKYELEKKDKEIENLYAQLEQTNKRLARFEKEYSPKKLTAINTTEVKQTKRISKSKSVKDAYREALALYNQKKYTDAMMKLKELRSSYPSHYLASNFVYWIGECYWGTGDFNNAIRSFEQVKHYRNSNKLDDAYIMAGLGYMKIGDYTNARLNFSQLLEKFPKSEFSGKAKKMLARVEAKIIS